MPGNVFQPNRLMHRTGLALKTTGMLAASGRVKRLGRARKGP
jgi:hypothetical protein